MGGFGAFRRAIAHLAENQHGLVTRQQLVALGMTVRQIERGIARGDLRILHRAVYRVGPFTSPHACEMGAVLACGDGAVVSHRSAIYLHKLLPYPAQRGSVHVTVTGSHRCGDGQLVVHHASDLRHYEVRNLDGIPVTAPIRSLIDFAAGSNDEELERAVAEAFALRLTQRVPLLREVERQRRRRGTGRLRALLDGEGPRRTRSPPERKLLGALRADGVDGFQTNHKLGEWEVDFYWPDACLVVEVDAYSTHSSPAAFERDRRKSADLEDRGLKVRRVTKARIDHDVGELVAEIRRLIRRAAP